MKRNNPFNRNGVVIRIWHQSATKYFVLIALLMVLGLSLSGCVTLADPEASQDYTSDAVAELDAQTSLGQSFISRRPDLNGITIWLTRISDKTSEPSSPNVDNITVKLFLSPGDRVPVFTTTVIAPSSGDNLPITVSMPDQKNPGGQGYYLLLENDSGTIQVNGRNEDAYSPGQAYINSAPINADIAFRLTYHYGFYAFVQDVTGSAVSLWLIIPLLITLWLPGWLLLELSGLRSHYDFGEQTALATALSMALIPVLMLWTTVLGIKWTSRGLYINAGFLVAVFFVRLAYVTITSHKNHPIADTHQSTSAYTPPGRKLKLFSWHSLALMLVFLVTLTVRLIMVRDLATPAWVDSVHHALITRIIMNTGAFPSTYLPFLDFTPPSYHPGFHSIAAVFTWLSQLDLARSLLISGQVLNALSVFSLYLFTKTLTRSASAGLFASIITGFLTPMPAYYTSWGRYTELAGLLLLPVSLALLQPWMDGTAGRRSAWIIILGAITAGGVFMIHYRVVVFLVCLVISYVILHLIPGKDTSNIKPLRLLAVIFIMAVLGIIVVLPWFIQTVRTTLIPYVSASTASSGSLFQDFSLPFLTSALGTQAMVVAGLGLLWSLLKGKRFTFIIIVWIFLLIILANLAALKLPGSGLISTLSVEIMLYIPISILGGFFVDQLFSSWRAMIPSRLVLPASAIVVVLVGYVSFLGARQLIPILNPITILSRSADIRAIEWVKENIPIDETIVINPFAWGYGLYAGNDGGYWISPLSGRLTLPPPVLYGLGGGVKQISQMSQQIASLSSDPAAFREYLLSHQLHYVYIGVRGGVIPPEKLASSGLFMTIYHQEGVWIFSVKP